MDKVAAATVREWHCDKQLSVSDVCNFTLQIDISCVDILGPPKARKKNAMHWYYCQLVISTTSKNKTRKNYETLSNAALKTKPKGNNSILFRQKASIGNHAPHCRKWFRPSKIAPKPS